MRSKLPTVAIGRYDAVTFDLIRSGLSRTTFPWSGRLWQMETISPYRYRASWACRRKVSSRTGFKWGLLSSKHRKSLRTFIRRLLCWQYLSSRQVTLQVLSAQMSLTSVFGMGTGGPSSQSLPTRLDGFEAIVYVKSFSALNSFILPLLFVAVNSSFSKSNTLVLECVRNGDPYRIRTDVKGVRGLCLNHLTNGPWCTFTDSNRGPTD